jgi:aryl-alcohol dehydrogenase-like predicted oxidoreductase
VSAPRSAPVPGCATRAGTEAYVRTFGRDCAVGHYSDFLNLHLKLSSLGVGTFGGAATDDVDAACASVVTRALTSGINVIDTAAHYRYGRSARAVGAGLRAALAQGVGREQVFLVSKGGFLLFDDGPPHDPQAWFEREIAGRGLGRREDLTGVHLLSPEYLDWQIDRSREALGVETLDAFLVDQPEVHMPVIGKAATNEKLERCFVALERAVKDGRIACYGIATFSGFRVETDHPLFESITSLQGHAQKAAQQAWGDVNAKHTFRVVTLPFNQVMLEGFTRFSQATGHGNVGSTIQAAHQLRVYVLASHALAKGHLASQCVDGVFAALPQLRNHAQRSLQFNRSTPGLGTSLVGISTPAHLDDVLAVAQMPPLAKSAYLQMYQRAD